MQAGVLADGSSREVAHFWAAGRSAVAAAGLGLGPAATLLALLPWGKDAAAEEEIGTASVC